MTEAAIEIVNGQIARSGKHEWAMKPYTVAFAITLLNSLAPTEWCPMDRLVKMFNGGRISDHARATWRKRMTKIKKDALKKGVLLNVKRNDRDQITHVKPFLGDPEERQSMLDEIEGMKARKDAAEDTLEMATQLALALDRPTLAPTA